MTNESKRDWGNGPLGKKQFGFVRDYPHYVIYSDGSIFSIRGGGYLKQTKERFNYMTVRIYSKKGVGKKFRVSRLVLTAFCGEPKGKNIHAAHLNGNSLDNRIQNLIWATPKENDSHKEIHGTRLNGSKHSAAKITERSVKRIRTIYFNTENKRGLVPKWAREYGMSKTAISRLLIGRTWRHVKMPSIEEIKRDPIKSPNQVKE